MPKKREDEGALGSVLDFIFTESKKKPDKVKPLKVTGVDGTFEYADAITAVLENPLLFVNKTTEGAFKDLVNPDLVRVKVGPGERDDIRVSLFNVGDILNNRMEFIDKQFARMEQQRKLGRLTWAGQEIGGLIAANWAKNRGLDYDTQRALMSMGKQNPANRDLLKSSWTAGRTKGLADKYLAPGGPKITEQMIKSRYQDEKQAKKMLQKYENWGKKYNSTNLNDRENLNYDEELYRFLESQDLMSKANEARGAGDKEKAVGYAKASYFLEANGQPKAMGNYISKQRVTISNYKKNIEALRKSSDPDKKEKIKELEKRIRDINGDIRDSYSIRNARRLGEIEGTWMSVKGLWEYTAGGELAGAFVTGDFFDKRKSKASWLLPTADNDGSVKIYVKGKEDPLKVSFLTPKTGENKFANAYYEKMMSIYYMNPVTWIKSLGTGEAFAYKLSKLEEKFTKQILEELKDYDFAKDFEIGKLFDKDSEQYLDFLKTTITADQMKTISKFMKSRNNWANLTRIFSSGKRAKDKIGEFLRDKIKRNIREKVGGWLKAKVVGDAAKVLVGQWIAKGSIQALVKGLITSVFAAAGTTLGPIGTFVAGAVSWVATGMIEKMSKPIIKVTTQALVFGIIGIFAMIYLVLAMGIAVFGQFSHVAPTQIVSCEPGYGLSAVIDPTDPNDPNNPDNPIGPLEEFIEGSLPPGEECLLGTGSYSCTQGPYGNYSHARVAAIDLGGVDYFHAPKFCSGGNCKVTYSGSVNCTAGYAGGMVIVSAEYEGHTYQFKMIHVDSKLSVGDTVTSGQRVARVMRWDETGNACSSGKHLHLEAKQDGASVNPHDIMTKGFGCSISQCR